MPLSDIVSLLLYANAVVVIVLMIHDERDPSTTLAWSLGLILFPGVGLAFYLLFGRNWRAIGQRDARRAEAERLGDEAMRPVYERFAAQSTEALWHKPEFVRSLATAIEAQNGSKPLPCTDLKIYDNGAEKFAALFADIEAATDHIHLQYFIWEQDELSGRLCELLAEKAREGVEVRVMYDWVGSLPYGKQQLHRLKAAGALVHADAAHWTKLNYRNHRKVAVIDGRIGYTGGMNVGQEYIDGQPRFPTWRDTHIRFTGPLVTDLQRLFLERWFRITKASLFTKRYLPVLDVGDKPFVWAHLAHSGPESELAAIRNVMMLAIMSAKTRVWIQSPYFVPDEAIEQALITQSYAGVDVRLMMTALPDKRIAWNAAFSYIDELVDARGSVLQYEAGFFHAKSLTIDGQVGVLGTTNFDIRSFMLHDELNVFFYEPAVAEELDRLFARDIKECRVIDHDLLDELTVIGRFGNALARLWSRLL